jgi:hypothetical protein
MQPDITHWTFGRYVVLFVEFSWPGVSHFRLANPSLQRQEDGTFKDADLANILHNACVPYRSPNEPAILNPCPAQNILPVLSELGELQVRN